MSDQEDRTTEQDLLPDEGPDPGAGGASDRDAGVEDFTGVGAGDDRIRSGEEEPDDRDLPAEGFEGV